ncbi:MAG: glycosyl transferase, partial [Bacteroidia bacterium]|nr:glycosyl transferase [Bacteroidia bacterium]
RAKVDVLVSGIQSEIELPFPIKYRLKGISFVFGKNGGINYFKTLKINNIFRIIKEIKNCNVHEYDLIINDFEPISAWACFFKNSINCVSLSHQSALLSSKVPKPKKNSLLGKFILKYYAPANIKYGFHFKTFDKNIFSPIIRDEIRKQFIREKKYYVIYLPSYSDEKIISVLKHLSSKIKWRIFSKHSKIPYRYGNIKVKPIGSSSFEKSMAYAKGIICGAGFETPSEALYLEKKLLVIPMKGQYEQACNAESLKQLGVDVLPEFKGKYLKELKNWLFNDKLIDISFPDQTQKIVDEIITNHIIVTRLYDEVIEQI